MSKACSTPGCTMPHRARGMCTSCYGRWRRAELAKGAPRKACRPAVLPDVRSAGLSIVERAGSDQHCSATWRLRCTCGHEFIASAPRIKDGSARCQVCHPPVATVQEQAVLALLPAAKFEIIEGAGMTEPMVEHRLERMRADGKCHIGGWKRAPTNGARTPVFHAGPGKDVPCKLPRLNNAISSRRYRAKIRGTEKWDQRNAKLRANYWADKAAVQGDPLVQALFGRAA